MKVSVIIPCFNAEAYIGECIDSVMNQTFQELEVICIDNNSTDRTSAVLNEYAKKYRNKIIVISEVEKGASAARNKGLKFAKGSWLQFLDADDILLPSKIDSQLKGENEAEADIIVGNYIRVKNDKETKIVQEKNEWIGLIVGRLGITSSNLWRKEKVLEAGGWDMIKSSQEANLLFKMLKQKAKVKYQEDFDTIVINRNSRSISNVDRKSNWIRYIGLRLEIWRYLKESGLLTEQISFALKKNIFNSIRILYSYDPASALDLHSKHVAGIFGPQRSFGTSFLYIIAYKCFGFSFVQRLSSWLWPIADK